MTVRIAAVRDVTPAVTDLDFLVVDREALTRRAARPTALLLTGGHLDGAALRRAAGGGVDVRLRAEVRTAYVHSPLQSGAERIYTAAVAAGAGYAVLALLLALVRAAPERSALLARLRTMGLTWPRGGACWSWSPCRRPCWRRWAARSRAGRPSVSSPPGSI